MKTARKYNPKGLYDVLMTHELNLEKTKEKTLKSKDQLDEENKKKKKANCLEIYRR